MSLYDDIDEKKTSENLSGWATGIKYLQNHKALKKATVTQPKRDLARKQANVRLNPVIDLNKGKIGGKKDEDGNLGGTGLTPFIIPYTTVTKGKKEKKYSKSKLLSKYLSVDPEWQIPNEYDPIWPNDYEKALKELRDRRDKEAEEEEAKRKLDEEKEEENALQGIISNIPSSGKNASGGVAIAPPPSLTTISSNFEIEAPKPRKPAFSLGGSGSSAAARIMAKYGYKEGQGLGKKEQGMSTALLVEKTSHRTGRIIHENEIKASFSLSNSLAAYNDDVEFETENPEIKKEEDSQTDMGANGSQESEPTLAELLKNPSKVVLLKNMVGPGEVDDDLEPEVKEECETKYGDVNHVTIYQMPDLESDDAIRIFVEFKRVESAVKALVDLNGRFFGGRQVRALFYEYEKFTNLELTL